MAQVSSKFRDIAGGGLSYWCQGCKEMHTVWLQGHEPNDGRPRWSFNGDLEKPVFGPSVLVTGRDFTPKGRADFEAWHAAGCPPRNGEKFDSSPTVCHTFIGCNGAEPGEVIFLSDCTHEFAGTVQTLPDLPEHARD